MFLIKKEKFIHFGHAFNDHLLSLRKIKKHVKQCKIFTLMKKHTINIFPQFILMMLFR